MADITGTGTVSTETTEEATGSAAVAADTSTDSVITEEVTEEATADAKPTTKRKYDPQGWTPYTAKVGVTLTAVQLEAALAHFTTEAAKPKAPKVVKHLAEIMVHLSKSGRKSYFRSEYTPQEAKVLSAWVGTKVESFGSKAVARLQAQLAMIDH